MSGIRRVWGTADDIHLVFTYSEVTGRWEAEVPIPEDGRYIVALYAEDMAGNTAYVAKMLFTIDLRNMCVTFEVLEISSEASMREVTTFLISLDGCKKGIGGCNGEPFNVCW